MSFMSQPKGGSDVQDALTAIQRAPKYTKPENRGKQGQQDNISEYVRHNLKNIAKPRHGEHR